MQLDKVIQELDEIDFCTISSQFRQNKSKKFLRLFELYRKHTDEGELFAQLNVSNAAFYTLKSRLMDKIQDYLYKNVKDERSEILKNVANIDNLIFQFPKETAIAIIKKIEQDLIKNDMQQELTVVYHALKKMNINTEKYYEYSQKYNIAVANSLAIDKGENVLLDFNQKLGQYYLNKEEQDFKRLMFYKKEINNLLNLYPSDHLLVFKYLIDVQYSLFVRQSDESIEEHSIEELLRRIVSVYNEHTDDKCYSFIMKYLDVLYFEYYIQQKLFVNAQKYFEKIVFNNLNKVHCNRCYFTFNFFISTIKLYKFNSKEDRLLTDVEAFDIEINLDNVFEKILFANFIAYSCYYSSSFKKGITTLNKLLSELSLKSFIHSEIEIKLFLLLFYALEGMHEHFNSTYRSLVRKIKDAIQYDYENALTLADILKTSISTRSEDSKLFRIRELSTKFNLLNNSSRAVLPGLGIDDLFVNKLLSRKSIQLIRA